MGDGVKLLHERHTYLFSVRILLYPSLQFRMQIHRHVIAQYQCTDLARNRILPEGIVGPYINIHIEIWPSNNSMPSRFPYQITYQNLAKDLSIMYYSFQATYLIY